jgi:uncharacterized membrane protein YkoI
MRGLALFSTLALLWFVAPAAAQTARQCLNAAETREAVQEKKLTDPTAALKTAAAHARAEALRSRLCRWNDDYVYEITLLRRDGKVMHVNVRAADGQIAGARER